MYVDCLEHEGEGGGEGEGEGEGGGEGEGEGEDKPLDEYYAMVVGISKADAHLHIISAVIDTDISAARDAWSDVNEITRSLPDITLSSSPHQYHRNPY